MESDIVERLQQAAPGHVRCTPDMLLIREAASELTRLRAALAAAEAERDRMREALVKIDFIPLPVDEADSHSVILNIKYIARAALANEGT